VSWIALVLVLAAGPTEWALPGVRVHVQASEELDPDRLRALARPDVVLWLRTRSNGLRRSTAETLRLAGSALVEVEGTFTEELASRLRVLRPVAIRWRRAGWPAREEWARARRFGGVELSPTGEDVECTVVPPKTKVRVRVDRPRTSDEVCGLPVRVQLAPEASLADAQQALLGHVDADLGVEVGEDAVRAASVARLLDALEATTPQGRPGESK